MITQNIKTAFRYFRTNWNYTLINASGLIIAFICAFVLLTFAMFELSYDKFHENNALIYRVNELLTSPNDVSNSPNARVPVGPDLYNEFPEIDNFARIRLFRNTEISYLEKTIAVDEYLFADTSFFSMFSFKLIQGNQTNILKDPASIVLTEEKSSQLFNGENPIGRSVQFKKNEYIVAGVCEKPPLNSHLQFDCIIPIKNLLSEPNQYFAWDGGISVTTFIKLLPSTDANRLEKKIEDFVYKKLNRKLEADGFFSKLYLENIAKIHLFSRSDYDQFRTGNFTTIIILSIISFAILIMASLNFISISLGLNLNRIKDFNTRINLGAGRGFIRKQLVTETSLIILFASLSAFIIVILLSNDITPLFGLTEDFISQSITNALLILIPIILLIFFLISFSIIIKHPLKSDTFKQKQHQQFNIASLFQLFATIVLFIVVWGIQKQHTFAMNKELGFDDENVIFAIHPGFTSNQLVLKNELAKIPGVVSSTFSFGIPGLEATRNGYKPEGEDNFQLYNVIYADNAFMNSYDIQLKEGNGFQEKPEEFSNKILINETLAKQLSWENPIGKTLYRDQNWEITGIVKDFHLGSIYSKIPPMILSNAFQNNFYALSLKIQNQNIQHTISAIEQTTAKIIHDETIDFSFFDEKFEMIYARIQVLKKIVLIFTLIALFISVLGIFGLSILSSRNRVKEVGIRKVNGAKVVEILILLNRNLIKSIFFACLFAIPVAHIILSKWLNSFAYKTNISWWIFAISVAATIFITLLTVSFQSWRAATRNPVEALRYE